MVLALYRALQAADSAVTDTGERRHHARPQRALTRGGGRQVLAAAEAAGGTIGRPGALTEAATRASSSIPTAIRGSGAQPHLGLEPDGTVRLP